MKIKLEKTLGIKIKNIKIFETAFTHRSAINEQKQLTIHNERLEFLGDAVLELIVTEYLYHNFPKQNEGVLTSLRASIVKGDTLSEIAKDLNFGDFLKMSRGEYLFGGREKTSLLSNTLEAVIGAIYLDSGIQSAYDFINRFLIPKLDIIIKKGEFIDAKSQFQQFAQAEYKLTPHYKEISSTGPDHDKIFEISVYVGEKKYGAGTGSSKQAAQQAAAENALNNLGINIGL